MSKNPSETEREFMTTWTLEQRFQKFCEDRVHPIGGLPAYLSADYEEVMQAREDFKKQLDSEVHPIGGLPAYLEDVCACPGITFTSLENSCYVSIEEVFGPCLEDD